jgi:hypothetical protein
MTLQDLQNFLNTHNVPTYLYTIGGLGDGECVGIDRSDDKWVVYFSERGSMNSIRSYSEEYHAIKDFLTRLNVQLEDFEGRKLPV